MATVPADEVDHAAVPGDDRRGGGRPHPLLEPLCRSCGLTVMRLLAPGPVRFNRLLAAADGVSHKVLTENLRRLERDGLVRREVTCAVPLQVQYSLTDDGQQLAAMLEQLRRWVDAHAAATSQARRRYDARQPGPSGAAVASAPALRSAVTAAPSPAPRTAPTTAPRPAPRTVPRTVPRQAPGEPLSP